jgi:hypothetical protein
MTTKRSLADLASQFENKKTNNNSNQDWKLFFQFWKAPVDSVTTIRWLPDLNEDNPASFLVENLTHELFINGKKETVACLEMYGEQCPICELSRKYYNKKSVDYNEFLGKKFYRKKEYLGQCLVLETQVEHDAEQLVKLIKIGPKILEQITAAFKSGDLDEDPWNFKGGYNFRIRKTQNGEFANYGTSNFSPKQTDISDDVIQKIELFNLEDKRTPKTDRVALEAMLLAAQTVSSAPAQSPRVVVDNDDSVDVTASIPETKPTVSTSGMTAIERLRARQAQQQVD